MARVDLLGETLESCTALAAEMCSAAPKERPPSLMAVVREAMTAIAAMLPSMPEARAVGLGNTHEEVVRSALRIALAYQKRLPQNREKTGSTTKLIGDAK